MKLTKLMLAAFVAAAALVSCNKEGTEPESKSLKSINISLENVIMTKGEAGEKIKAGDKVKVNNFKIILTDDSYSAEYTAWNADATEKAQFYFNGEEISSKPYGFHYVDHKVTKVIAVANMGDVTLQQIKSFTEEIADQQDQTSLVLWADATLVATGETHSPAGTDKYTEVFKADVTLEPVISRFEVDGFAVDFSTTPLYNKIEVLDIAFDHYYPTVGFTTADGTFKAVATGTHIKNVNDYDSDADVFGWLNNTATTGWYIDCFESSTLAAMVPDDPATTYKYENRVDTPKPLAYHFFAGDVVPTLVIRLLADGNPAYVYTSKFKSSSTNTDISTLEAGKIYRMSAPGQTDQTGGSILIPDESLDPIERCLEITISVQDWVVDLITPEF